MSDPIATYAWLCRSCRHTFVATVPNDAALEDLYDSYGYDVANPEDVPAFLDVIIGDLVQSFEPFRQTQKLLDVGFGNAGLLRIAAKHGWDAHGVELSPAAMTLGWKQGVRNLYHGDLLTLSLQEGSFDVITMSEVIEHLANPKPYLRRAAQLLRTGGLLFITTPHGRGLSGRVLGGSWSVLHPPQHLQLFSIDSMRRSVHGAGFSKVDVYTQGLLPHEIVAKVRARISTAPEMPRGHRVQLSCNLNQTLTERPLGRVMKRAANVVLRMTTLGDSLRVRALL